MFYGFTFEQFYPYVISTIFLILSIFLFHNNKNKIGLILLFLSSLGYGFFVSNLDHYLNLWDEQFHALVAKNMLKNPFKPTLYSDVVLDYDYKNWVGNYIWLHKQPLFLWQIALSLKIFGINELSVRLPSIILHAFTSILIYRIGKIAINSWVGYYGAVFFSVAYYPLQLVVGKHATDHNDIAFLFYITASFWAWFEYQNSNKKYWILLIGFFSGCAVLVKWLMGLLVFPAWFISIISNNPQKYLIFKNYLPILVSFLTSVIIFLPWQIYILINFPLEAKYEYLFNTKHLHEVIEEHGGSWWYHFDALKYIYSLGFFTYFLILPALFIFLINIERKVFIYFILSAIAITYGLYSYAATKMTGYCIIVSPFIFLSFGALCYYFFKNLNIENYFFDKTLKFITLITFCYFFNKLSDIRNYHVGYKAYAEKEYNQMAVIDKLKKTLDDRKWAVFNSSARLFGHIPVMFYTDYIAYDFVPTEEQIEKVKSKAYNIAVIEKDTLPNYILNDLSILKITLD